MTSKAKQTKPAAEAVTTPAPATKPTKIESVIELLRRKDGAALSELTAATGWQPHSARAVLTGLRKKGYVLEKSKRGEETCYRIADPA